MVFFLDILSKADYKGVGVSAAPLKVNLRRMFMFKELEKGDIKNWKDLLAGS